MAKTKGRLRVSACTVPAKSGQTSARSGRFTQQRTQYPWDGEVTLTVLEAPSAPASLYAAMEAVAPQSVALTLIPYYAWNNRGRGRMSAWLPLYG